MIIHIECGSNNVQHGRLVFVYSKVIKRKNSEDVDEHVFDTTKTFTYGDQEEILYDVDNPDEHFFCLNCNKRIKESDLTEIDTSVKH